MGRADPKKTHRYASIGRTPRLMHALGFTRTTPGKIPRVSISAGAMDKSLWLARLLSIGGVLEAVAGVGLLVAPSAIASFLLRSSLAGSGVVVARLGGGGLVALGIACWGARKTASEPASLGVSWGLLVYNIVACVTLAWTSAALVSGGLPALGASILHGMLGASLLTALLGRGRSGS